MQARRLNPIPAALVVGLAALIAGAVLSGAGVWVAVIGSAVAGSAGAYLVLRGSGGPVEHTQEGSNDLAQRVESLSSRLDLYRGVFEALGSAALVLDSAGRVVIANPAAARLLDREPADLIGLDPQALFTEADVHALCERASRGEVASGRVRIVRERFTGIFEGIAVPIALRGARGVILLLRDVTELAQAYELKTDFVGNASHELRTPIAALRAAVDTLIGPARDDGPMRDRLAVMIRDHVIRLEELVRDLLDLSRFETPDGTGAITRVDCVTLCAEIETMLAPLRADRDITLSFEFDPRLRGIRTDAQALLLILRNLVDNAIKFSHPGGAVRVVGSVTGGEPPRARVEVIDRGVGIPIAQQPRIFERFYQVDQARSGAMPRRGTGLGLAIVKHALKQIGGTIEVESVWNEGTTMTVEFPLEAPASVPRSEPLHPPAIA